MANKLNTCEFQKEETTKDNGAAFPSVDAVVIAVGQDEDVIYSKSTAIQVNHFNTILVLTVTWLGIDHLITLYMKYILECQLKWVYTFCALMHISS